MRIWDEPVAGESWLVGVSGRLDHSQDQLLEETLQRLLDEGHYRLIVDLSRVTYVNSGGLRSLVTIWRQARQQGGDIALCGLNEHIAKVFSVVGFDKIFQIYPNCADAQRGLASMDAND
jgi:anti-sigma B factor antagonist